MRKSALAYFRQLCCLGVGGPAVMPSLLKAMHDLIPSETNAFFWSDDANRLAAFLPEYVIPEVVDNLVGNFDGLVERTLPISFATAMTNGVAVGNLLPAFDRTFYRGPVYHLVYRPYQLHHAIDGIVRDAPAAAGKGALVIGRSARQSQFSATEQDLLRRLLPYVAHALHPRAQSAPDDFVDSGDCGLLLLDRSGRILHSTARARALLHMASESAATSGRSAASVATDRG